MSWRKSYPVSYLEFGANKTQKPAVLDCRHIIYSMLVGDRNELSDLFAEKDLSQNLLRIVRYEGKLWAIFKDNVEETPYDAPLYHARPLTKRESIVVEEQQNEDLNPVEVFEHVSALRRQANDLWHEVCRELAERIPRSLQTYAKEWDWIPDAKTKGWRLPDLIEQVVTHPAGCVWTVKENELEQYRFKSLVDCFNRFIELQKAWKGMVDLQVELFDYHVKLTFKAVD